MVKITTSLAPICKIKKVTRSTRRAGYLCEVIHFVAPISILYIPTKCGVFNLTFR